MTSLRSSAAAAAIVLLSLFAGCSDGKPAADLPPNVATIQTVTERIALVPEVIWKNPDGTETSFAAARGRVTLVNFWATWCAPCRKELPDLVELSRQYSDRGFRVIGVATDRTPNAAELVAEFVREFSIPYQIVISTQEMEDAFKNVRMMPTSFLVDQDGNIIRTILGYRTRAELEEVITPLL